MGAPRGSPPTARPVPTECWDRRPDQALHGHRRQVDEPVGRDGRRSTRSSSSHRRCSATGRPMPGKSSYRTSRPPATWRSALVVEGRVALLQRACRSPRSCTGDVARAVARRRRRRSCSGSSGCPRSTPIRRGSPSAPCRLDGVEHLTEGLEDLRQRTSRRCWSGSGCRSAFSTSPVSFDSCGIRTLSPGTPPASSISFLAASGVEQCSCRRRCRCRRRRWCSVRSWWPGPGVVVQLLVDLVPVDRLGDADPHVLLLEGRIVGREAVERVLQRPGMLMNRSPSTCSAVASAFGGRLFVTSSWLACRSAQ